MNPGKLNKRITFQRKTSAKDDDGFENTQQYEDVISVWAGAKTISGREYYQAAAVQNEKQVRWIIRYREGLTEDMRIRFKSRIFEIKAILDDDELKKTLTIVCEEVF